MEKFHIHLYLVAFLLFLLSEQLKKVKDTSIA